ncbi:response regulator [Thiomicrospira microaerophila]|uniref:response regulator n=1 Tax=Thiomicrospira microaerophila TaxID=406020 RepID=UPI0005C8D745|nr:response regulator [Thiomicrospira microaerophila]
MVQDNQILIIEDDQALRKMISAVLSQQGYKALQAKNLATAMEILDSESGIKCVVQDLGLPPKPHSIEAGLGSMRQILSMRPWLKVIVLTGHDKQDAATQAIKEGAFDFLQKPVSMDLLLAAISRALLFFDTEKNLTTQGCFAVSLNSSLDDSGLKGSKEGFELNLIKRVLEEENYRILNVAKRLGVRRENLYYLFRKHGIDSEWVHRMHAQRKN